MSVISKIKYADEASIRYPRRINGKIIDKININGTAYNFAEIATATGGAETTLSDSANGSLMSYSIYGNTEHSTPSGFVSESVKGVLMDNIDIYSNGINLFTTDYKTHSQAATYERLSSNSFLCYGSYTNISGVVRFDVPKVSAGSYYLSFTLTVRNSPDVARRNEILVWSVVNGASTIRTVYSCGGDVEEEQKGVWLYLPEDCELRVAWYSNMADCEIVDYYAKLENVSLTKGSFSSYEPFGGRNYFSITKAEINGNYYDNLELNSVNGKTDVLEVDKVNNRAVYKKNTYIKTFTGSEGWGGTSIASVGKVYFNDAYSSVPGYAVCTHFTYDETLSTPYSFKLVNERLYFKLTGTEDLLTFVNVLTQRYNADDQVKVVYGRSSTVEYEIINSTVKEKLFSLNSFEKNTKISIVSEVPPSRVEATYWKRITE